jgi:spermidine synthase
MRRFGSQRVFRNASKEVQIDVSERKGIRTLHLNRDDIQSSMRVKTPNELVLAYSRVMMGVLLFTDIHRCALIGLGGGSLPKFIYHYLPEAMQEVAELHPEVIAAARNMFFLPEDDARLRVRAMQGEALIPKLKHPVDVIFLDAFTADGIVDTLVAEDFLAQCQEKLTDTGALVVNLWGSDKLTPLYIERMRRVFDGGVIVLPTYPDRNRIAYAFKRTPSQLDWTALRARAKALNLPLDFHEMIASMQEFNQYTDKRLIVSSY